MTHLLHQTRSGNSKLHIKIIQPAFAISHLATHMTDPKSEKVFDTLKMAKVQAVFRQSEVFVKIGDNDTESKIVVPTEGSSFATPDVYLSFLAHLLNKVEERGSLAMRIFSDDFRPIICMSSLCVPEKDARRNKNLHLCFARNVAAERPKFEIRLIDPPGSTLGLYRRLERVVI